jgi:predicted Zn-dependent protease
MALLIGLIGWFMYWMSVEENPVTGEKQHVAISPDQEIQLGLQSAPQMSQQMGGELAASDPRASEVREMGQYIISNSVAKKSPWKFEFHLLADPNTVNAFALPGGQIFITLGLYNKLQNQAQLAGVLSHEIGHVIERHTAEQMAKSQLGQWLVMAAGSAAGSTPGVYGGASDPQVIAELVNKMVQLRFGRKDESEADTWGLKLMEEVGFNPRALIEVMQVLKEASGGGAGLEIFQTHPNPDLRIKQIDEYLRTHPPKPGLSDGESLKNRQIRSRENQPDSLESLFRYYLEQAQPVNP